MGTVLAWHRPMRSLPVGTSEVTKASMTTARAILHEGGTVCIYPTGRIECPTSRGSFRAGAFRLAQQTEAQILCVGMWHYRQARVPWLSRGLPARLGTTTEFGISDAAFAVIARDIIETLPCGQLTALGEATVQELEIQAASTGPGELAASLHELESVSQALRGRASIAIRVAASYELRRRSALVTWLARCARTARTSPGAGARP